MFANDDRMICVSCGTQFDTPLAQAPKLCRMCMVSRVLKLLQSAID